MNLNAYDHLITLSLISRRSLRSDVTFSPPPLGQPHSTGHHFWNLFLVVLIILYLTTIIVFTWSYCKHSRSRSPESNPNNNNSRNSEAENCCGAGSQQNPLSEIPVFTYGTTGNGMTSSSSSLNEEDESCPICLEEYLLGDAVRVLPRCNHMFHKECVDQWLTDRSSNCPICRDQTIEQDVQTSPSCDISVTHPHNYIHVNRGIL
ncbi:hypothetical protein ACFE04_002194 [Oxalis oulophora]